MKWGLKFVEEKQNNIDKKIKIMYNLFMLKIENIVQESIDTKLELDYYTPVSVIFLNNGDNIPGKFYYRYINENYSFIEIAINSLNGKIINVITISINDIDELTKKQSTELDMPVQYGNPILNLDDFIEEPFYISYNCNYKFLKANNNLYFTDINNKVERRIRFRHLDLLLNSLNDIIGFCFRGFENRKWNEINKNIKCKTIIHKKYYKENK
ncbi:hypothetical protein AGMMS49579_23550 [Spirochaetia bacterium]|nr:hypothetical protein AGMMS49579_23550 [Spirochaetia bacterium]